MSSIEDSKVERKRMGTDFTFFMIVMFHELTHQVQRKRSKLNYFDNQGLARIIMIILNNQYSDYECNHDTTEIEIDANEQGWKKCEEFYSKFYGGLNKDELLRNCYVNVHTSKARRTFALKKDANNMIYTAEMYDIEKLTECIKKNPAYLDEYPMLRKFYTERGLRYGFLGDSDMSNKSVGLAFINYFFEKNGIPGLIKIINSRKITDKEATNVVRNIFYYIRNNLHSIDGLKYITDRMSYGEYKNHEEFNIDVSNKLRIAYLKKAIIYLKKSLPLLEIISKEYPKTIDEIKYYIKEMQNRITTKTDELKNMLDEDTLRKIESISKVQLR